jgi:hypothetical protein
MELTYGQLTCGTHRMIGISTYRPCLESVALPLTTSCPVGPSRVGSMNRNTPERLGEREGSC